MEPPLLPSPRLRTALSMCSPATWSPDGTVMTKPQVIANIHGVLRSSGRLDHGRAAKVLAFRRALLTGEWRGHILTAGRG